MHHASCILYHPSCIIYPISCSIMNHVSFILYQVPFIYFMCQWYIADTVCHSCPACSGSCFGQNVVCNTKSRLCVCVEGYKLDPTGLVCTDISGATTNIPCRHQVDCASYPSTLCSRAVGKKMNNTVSKVVFRLIYFSLWNYVIWATVRSNMHSYP